MLVVRTMFELGHALGNQHWPAVVKGSRMFVPLTVDRKVMASVMRTHAFPGIRYEFRPGARGHPLPRPARGAAAVRRRQRAHSHAHGHSHDHADHDHASADHLADGHTH